MLPPRVGWKRGDRVSMKSGLEGRNNIACKHGRDPLTLGLNEVRPRRPEQYARVAGSGGLGERSQ